MADLSQPYFARLKIEGLKEPIDIPALPLSRLLARIGAEISNPSIRLRGKFDVQFSKAAFLPENSYLQDVLSGIDLSNVEVMTPEQEAEFSNSPWNTDPIYADYMTYSATDSNWNSISPEQQRYLRSHMDSNYANSKYWNGIHRR